MSGNNFVNNLLSYIMYLSYLLHGEVDSLCTAAFL